MLHQYLKHLSGWSLFFAISLSIIFYSEGKLMMFPGRTSAINQSGQTLQGYVSHAEFEQECLHCHVPVHCFSPSTCQSCHMDIAEQRAQADSLHGRLPGTDRCQSCHPEHLGRQSVITRVAFVNLDHTRLAGFSLDHHQTGYDGQPLNCSSCHTLERFGRASLDCLSCHVDHDHAGMGEHVALYGLDCLACHDGVDRMADFDHAAVYLLDGAHVDLACGDCHTAAAAANLTGDCASCHEDSAKYAGLFGQDCARCHTTQGWLPAQLVRHTFFLDHGGEGEVACETCHVGIYTNITCYGCHDHTPLDMLAVHAAQGISELVPCEGCHTTGLPGEADKFPFPKFSPPDRGWQQSTTLPLLSEAGFQD